MEKQIIEYTILAAWDDGTLTTSVTGRIADRGNIFQAWLNMRMIKCLLHRIILIASIIGVQSWAPYLAMRGMRVTGFGAEG